MKIKREYLFKLYKIIVCLNVFTFIFIVIIFFIYKNIAVKVHNPYFYITFLFLGITMVLAPYHKLNKMRKIDEIVLSNKDIVEKMIYGELKDYIGIPIFVLFVMIVIVIVLLGVALG